MKFLPSPGRRADLGRLECGLPPPDDWDAFRARQGQSEELPLPLELDDSPECSAPHAPCHVFVVDFSGSMLSTDWLPYRLAAALAAIGSYVSRVLAETRDSIVAAVCFSDTAHVLCPWTPVTALANWPLVEREWCERCAAFGFGNTALGEGLCLALDLLTTCSGPAQAVVLTDGHHNEGLNPREIAPHLKRRASVAVVGIGGAPSEVDEPLLKEVASLDGAGTPRYRWIGDGPRALATHFRALAGHLSRS